jgi:hypothetical protein
MVLRNANRDDAERLGHEPSSQYPFTCWQSTLFLGEREKKKAFRVWEDSMIMSPAFPSPLPTNQPNHINQGQEEGERRGGSSKERRKQTWRREGGGEEGKDLLKRFSLG